MGGSTTPSVPRAPNAAKSYQQGIDVYLKNLPALLGAEEHARAQYDPQRVAEQQGLQSQFGPTQYQQQLDSLKQLDPTGTALREKLGNQISGDLSTGYQLPEQYATELRNSIRGAQTARGNALGNSASADEAGFMGEAALRLYQQRLQNAGNFINGASPEQQLLSVQPVQADRSSQYANPNAGFQGQAFALNNYQNLLAQRAASGAGTNPWASALGGAASGAAAGTMISPGYGTAIGAIAGGLYGGLSSAYSDRRVKENIEPAGEKNGLTLYRFNYKSDKSKRYIGVMADEVAKIIPRAIKHATGWLSDFMTVDYGALGLQLQEVN